ncbi:MAG: chitobiase/beta-hexosaminidase C-terminal domain-containing protein [Planctomycetota bacterium]|nr:chitobiase/beta-hexosaminidase C-terminal domain-containing protein [Planctomycetota bacterium]
MPEVDKDVIVFEWDGRFFSPKPITAAGYKIINVPWEPSVGWPARANYEWNMWLVGSQDREPDQLPRAADPAQDVVIGGQMVFWECPGTVAVYMLRRTAPARHERCHSPDAGKTFEDFSRRWAGSDRVLDLLIHRFTVKADGLFSNPDGWFTKQVTLTPELSPTAAGATLRYTTDGKDVTAQSPEWTAPLALTATTQIRSRLYDAAGKPLGCQRMVDYVCRPLDGQVAGLLSRTLRFRRFADPITVTVTSAQPGEIRYTLDGSKPAAKSALYTGPVKVAGATTRFQAALFTPDGKPIGEPWGETYTWVNYEKNLTTGKPVTTNRGETTNLAPVDGTVEPEVHWGGDSGGWYQVDLQAVHKLNEVHLYTWFGDGRVYTYNIELSVDGKTWKKVVDGSANKVPASEKGYCHKIEPTDARYVRVTMLTNSANPAIHISEIRVYEQK